VSKSITLAELIDRTTDAVVDHTKGPWDDQRIAWALVCQPEWRAFVDRAWPMNLGYGFWYWTGRFIRGRVRARLAERGLVEEKRERVEITGRSDESHVVTGVRVRSESATKKKRASKKHAMKVDQLLYLDSHGRVTYASASGEPDEKAYPAVFLPGDFTVIVEEFSEQDVPVAP
jgi:hypothetical protein